jgi:hypothetical protein
MHGHPPYAITSKVESLSGPHRSFLQTAFRPAVGNADKSGESGNVEERFDPLHGSSKRGANIWFRQGLLQ